MIRSRVDLPEPLGPEQRGERALGHLERDVAEGGEVAELLAHAVYRDHAVLSRLRSRVVMSRRVTSANAMRTVDAA